MMRRPDSAANEQDAPPGDPSICGFVRPLGATGGLTLQHWQDVHGIVAEAIATLGLTLCLVDEQACGLGGLGNIVPSLHGDPIVIMDVSGRDADVMFALGMRMAFGKPLVIIKDEETRFELDLGMLRVVEYRRDLRYRDTMRFKDELAKTVAAVASEKPGRGYLERFGPIHAPELGSRLVGLDEIARDVRQIKHALRLGGGGDGGMPFSSVEAPASGPAPSEAGRQPAPAGKVERMEVEVPLSMVEEFGASVANLPNAAFDSWSEGKALVLVRGGAAELFATVRRVGAIASGLVRQAEGRREPAERRSGG